MEKSNQIEQALLELGTEMMRLRGEIGDLKEQQDRFVEVINGLKLILDEKGIINSDEFENSIEVLSTLSGQGYDVSLEEEIEKIKKIQH